MIKNINSKMTTNSQLSTNEPKKIKERKTMKTKTKQTEQEQNQRNGHHMEGFQWGRGGDCLLYTSDAADE